MNISNAACGVMAYLLSDGEAAWTVAEIKREDVIKTMHDTVLNWNLKEKRNVRYRSFVPMYRLLECSHTSVVQYWAAWEICNMTLKDPARYSPMLHEEEGVPVLRRISEDPRTTDNVRSLTEMILDMVSQNSVLC